MMRNILPFINYICILPFVLVLSTVFVIDNSLNEGITSGKYFWFYISISAAAIACVISYTFNRRAVKFTFTDLCVAFFCLSGVLTSYLVNGDINNKLILFILAFCLYFLLRIFIVQTDSAKYVLVGFFILTGLVEAIWGMRQLYGYSYSYHYLFKTTGSFHNPGPYAGYLAVVLPAALYFILKNCKVSKLKLKNIFFSFRSRYVISIITFIAIIVILPATMSRASWVAAAGGCFFVGVFFLLQKDRKVTLKELYRKYKNKILLISFISIFAIGLCSLFIYNVKKDSADGRILIWKVSSQLLSANRIGVGLGNFPGVYGEQQAKYFESGQASDHERYIAGNPEYAFNEYLQIYIELGTIPFIFFILAIASTIYIGIKRRRIALTGSFISLLIFSFLSYPLNILPFVIVFAFLMAVCVSRNHQISYSDDLKNFYVCDFHTRNKQNRLIISSLLFALIVVVFLCVRNRYPSYQAYKDWTRASVLFDSGAYKAALEMHERIYPCLNDQPLFMFQYGQCLSKLGKFEGSNSILRQATAISCDPMIYNIMGKNYQSLGDYAEAEKCYKRAAYIVPNRIYPYYLLAKMYAEKGCYNEFNNMAKLVLDKKVKVDSPAVKEMKDEILKMLEKDSL